MESWIKDRPALGLLTAEGKTESGGGVLVHSCKEVQSALDRGFLPENIFYPAPFDSGVRETVGCCRFVAGSLRDLQFLDQAARDAGPGSIVKAGLRLQAPELPHAGNTILPDELSHYAREIKALRHLTVRGCFFCAELTNVHGAELGRFFRAGYEAAKRMTVMLPCAMPYLCFENAAAAIRENAAGHPETIEQCLRALDIMIMQNETAFYAKLYLS